MKNKMKKFLEKLSKRKYRGVSLVEALVYLAILASVFTVIFEFAIIISDANRTEEIDLDMQTNKVLIVENLEEAVSLAKQICRQGHSVVLSPAASSYDHFKNFEERGRIFEELALHGS